jgi:hypothetical protein
MDKTEWIKKCEFLALTGIYFKNKNENLKYPNDSNDSNDSIITISSSSDTCCSDDQIKLKKTLFFSVNSCFFFI